MKLHSSKFAVSLAVALGSLLTESVSRAAVMVSNLDQPVYSSFPVGAWWGGNQFITDNSAPSFLLDGVTIRMDTASAAPGNFFVAIFSSAGDRPGTLLETLSGSSNPAAAGNYSYTSTGLSLAPNTSYWIVAGVSSGGGAATGYNWIVSGETFSYSGPWVIPATDTHITSAPVGGANWNDFINDGYPRQFSVSATAVVPEPSSCILVGLGAAALLLRPRRRA